MSQTESGNPSEKSRGEDYVLSIDIGTQSVRAIIFDSRGKIRGMRKLEYEAYFSPQPGWAEKEPMDYWHGMCEVIKGLREEEGGEEFWPFLRCMVVTALRDTAVCLDSEDNIVRPSILWLDQRMAAQKPNLKFPFNFAVKAIGMQETLNILYRKTKSNWLMENEPQNWERIARYPQVSGFINYFLTDNYLDSNASQIGYIPFDYKQKQWEGESGLKYKLMKVDRSKLPDIVEPGNILGHVTPWASAQTGVPEGLPVIAGGSDKGCETLGVGCLDETMASISLGTTATIQTTTRRYYEAIRFLPPYPAVIADSYNPEIQIFRGYWLISWFKREFSKKECIEAEHMDITPEELLNSRVEKVPPGCEGLVLHPLWSPGILAPKAKGSVIGFGDVHTHTHVYRAIIEGIGFSLFEGLQKIEKKSKTTVKTLAISGGGSQSDVICQITADIFNRPVKRIHTHEASGLGAAIIGMVGSGVYSTFEEALQQMVKYEDIFEPGPENVKIYQDLFKNVFVNIYPRLKGIYDEIQRITNYPQI